MSDLSERLLAPSVLVLVLALIPALPWGWPAYTYRYGEPVEVSYPGPCDLSAERRGPLTTVCDATLVGAAGGTRPGRVTDNLGAPLPPAPATVAARAWHDLARTEMSRVEYWAGLVGPPVAAVSLLVFLVTATPFVIATVRDARADDSAAVPRQTG